MNLARVFTCFLAAACVSALPRHALAQSPSKPLTIVVPFTAGGQADVIARTVATSLAGVLGSGVIVENAPGAGGIIAAKKVLSAAADGHMLLLGSPSQLVLAGLINKDVPIKSTDFIPIHMVGISPYAVMARSGLKAGSGDELATLAREAAKSGRPLTYASVGVGTFNHLLGEELSRRVEAPLVHVPYKGAAEVMRDLIGGRIDLFINIYTAQQIALAEEGRFKYIAALSSARQTLLPTVVAADESAALRGFHSEIWIGLFVREGTPTAVVSALNKAMARTMADEALQKSLLDQTGLKPARPRPSAAEVAAEYSAGVQKFREMAKAANIVAQ